MTKVHPAYRARERARWTRPNAHHFVRPDWRRHVARGSELAAYFESIERKYRPDQARLPAGDPGGGQWTEEGGSGEGGGVNSTGNSERPRHVQFNPDERSIRSGRLIQLGGEDLGAFGNGISIVKGPNISHQEVLDPDSGVTTLSFTGIGVVVVDEKDGQLVTGSSYTVGTPARPDEGMSITIDRSGKVRTYPTSGG